MLDMNYFNGTLIRLRLEQFIKATKKPIIAVVGKASDPSSINVVDKKKAIDLVYDFDYVMAKELDSVIYLRLYRNRSEYRND